MSDSNFSKTSPKILVDSGLLFEINRKILHPLGMALCVVTDDESGEAIEIFLKETTELEGVVFSEGSFLDGERKLESYMKNIGNNKRSTRKTAIGFEEQISADQGNLSSYPPPAKPEN